MEGSSSWHPVTDCWLCEMKKAFRAVAFSAGVERVWPWERVVSVVVAAFVDPTDVLFCIC